MLMPIGSFDGAAAGLELSTVIGVLEGSSDGTATGLELRSAIGALDESINGIPEDSELGEDVEAPAGN